MTAVDRVKKICKERKIPISKLEADLGFGNAYISGLKKGVFPNDRLISISEYLDLPVEYLATGENPALEKYDTEYAKLVGKIRSDSELSNALIKYFELPIKKKKYVVELICLLSE